MNMPQRPDQAYNPPPSALSPNSQSGIFRGRYVIVFGPGSGVFVYSPIPGAGNLIASITAANGTDPFGNAFLSGIVSYVVPAFDGHSNVRLNNGALTFPGSAGTAFQNPPGLGGTGDGTAAKGALLSLASGVSTAGTAQASFVMMDANAANIAIGRAQPLIQTSANIMSQLGTSGEWQNLNLSAGFAAGTVTPQAQLEPIGSAGRIRLRGGVGLTANHAAVTTFATLPYGAPFLPTSGPFAYVTPNNLSGFSISNGTVVVPGGGSANLTMQSAGSNGNSFFLDGITIPLD